ncbi:DUF6625 family protein [Leuconostoc mesenteroides]|uniref:DUF6625 family protein n=1 Tax=Leuconostoc mesenteroides TaxID=1245 RepID=UPI00235F6922|nr:DUF6625 family protein [Leuconostoc mesenteroides]
MKKTIIIPYYGKFPAFFQLFLNSCKWNKGFNWLIFTDNEDKYIYPDNVKKIKLSFNELRDIVQSKFDFKIILNSPYKLCDYKVAYGIIFSDWLIDSDWWGFSDCDVIYGNLDKLITKEMYNNDKIFTLGHFALFRNKKEINNAFFTKFEGVEYAKKVFTRNDSFGFDEMIINDIFEENRFKIYSLDLSANISVYYNNFRIVKRVYDLHRYITEEFVPAIYYWGNGGVYRLFYNDDDGRIIKSEFLYIHMQQRNLSLRDDLANYRNVFQILPNSIISLKSEPRVDEFDKYHFKERLSRKSIHYMNNLVRYKVKRKLSLLFKGKFLRGRY